MKKDDVEEYLAGYGYILGNIKTVTDPAEEGTVLSQDPVEGTPLEKDSKINIEVSDGKGKEMGTVPSVTGLTLDEAKKLIRKAGFEVGNINYYYSDNVDKGYVIYQQYLANTELEKGTKIQIDVSSGPEPVPEPEPEPEPAETPEQPAEQPAETPEG